MSLLITVLIACGAGEPTSSPASAVAEAPAELGPTELADIARELQDSPDPAATLEKHGLDEASFTAAMYTIAGDPSASKAYEAALRR